MNGRWKMLIGRRMVGLVKRLTLILWAAMALNGCGGDPTTKALERGAQFLASIQRADGAICDSVNPLFDVWETVEAATALYAYHKDTADPTLQKALGFLLGAENPAGLLCHNLKCRAAYCLETTSEYFILLAQIYGPERIQPRMDTLRKLQLPTGQWEIGNPDVLEAKDFPSVTGFVLAAFQAAEMEPAHPQAAWDWLASRQSIEGDWGSTWEYYGCPAYALWPIMRAWGAKPGDAPSIPVRRATEYIFRTQMPVAHWDQGNPQDPKRASAELQTALMLAAYPDAIGTVGHQAVENGIQFLLQRQQPDGHWDGGYFPIPNARYEKKEYVFATARAMVALEMKLREGKGPGVVE